MQRDYFTDDINKKLEQFHLIFDRNNDLLTSVLRGHMIVEERLHDVITAGVACYFRPNDRNDIFTFGTATELCRSILGQAASPDIWVAIKSLNNLRNAIGHRNKPARLGSLLIRFFKDSESIASMVYKGGAHYDTEGESESTHAIAVRVRIRAIWTILGILADDLAYDLEDALKTRRHCPRNS